MNKTENYKSNEILVTEYCQSSCFTGGTAKKSMNVSVTTVTTTLLGSLRSARANSCSLCSRCRCTDYQ